MLKNIMMEMCSTFVLSLEYINMLTEMACMYARH